MELKFNYNMHQEYMHAPNNNLGKSLTLSRQN